MFASPDYQTDGISHFGFPVFKENKVLFQAKTQSERNKQDVAFLFAKALSEFVSFKFFLNDLLSEIRTQLYYSLTC